MDSESIVVCRLGGIEKDIFCCRCGDNGDNEIRGVF